MEPRSQETTWKDICVATFGGGSFVYKRESGGQLFAFLIEDEVENDAVVNSAIHARCPVFLAPGDLLAWAREV